MFSIVDKIVYPMYRAVLIEKLEEKLIDGVKRIYYVMDIPVGNLKISVSAKNAKNLGLREVYSGDEVLEVLEEVNDIPIDMPDNWNERYKSNLEKIKTGKLIEVVEVYRNLYLRENERGLSSLEKKLLTNSKQILLSELALSKSLNKEEAESILDDCIVKWMEDIED